MKIEWLKDAVGGNRYGNCNQCGISTNDTEELRRVRFANTSIVLCQECGELVSDMLSKHFSKSEDDVNEMKRCPICCKKVFRSNMNYTRDCHGITFRLVCSRCYPKIMQNGYDGEYYTEEDEQIEMED